MLEINSPVCMMILIDYGVCFVINCKIACFLIKVSIVFVAVECKEVSFLLQQMIYILVNLLISLSAFDPVFIIKQIIQTVMALCINGGITVNIKLAVRICQCLIDNIRNRSVSGILRIGIIITCIAVFIRLIALNRTVFISVIINIRIMTRAIDRSTIRQEQYILLRISSRINSAGSICIRMSPLFSIIIPMIPIIVCLGLQIGIAVIKQCEFDTLGNIIDSIDRSRVNVRSILIVLCIKDLNPVTKHKLR